MMRIRLFLLFIAFSLLALVRPRKCLELLEAADNWARFCTRPLHPGMPFSVHVATAAADKRALSRRKGAPK